MITAATKLKRVAVGVISALLLIVPNSAISQSPAAEVPAGWAKVSAAREFHLMAPAGTEYRPGKGIESLVGSFESADFKLSFDYGAYSDALQHLRGDAGYAVRDIMVGGKPAKVVTARAPRLSADRPYFIGIHFPEIKTTVVGPTKLTLFGLFETADNYPLIEKIFTTIRFD